MARLPRSQWQVLAVPSDPSCGFLATWRAIGVLSSSSTRLIFVLRSSKHRAFLDLIVKPLTLAGSRITPSSTPFRVKDLRLMLLTLRFLRIR